TDLGAERALRGSKGAQNSWSKCETATPRRGGEWLSRLPDDPLAARLKNSDLSLGSHEAPGCVARTPKWPRLWGEPLALPDDPWKPIAGPLFLKRPASGGGVAHLFFAICEESQAIGFGARGQECDPGVARLLGCSVARLPGCPVARARARAWGNLSALRSSSTRARSSSRPPRCSMGRAALSCCR
ncbi:MAG: hypothetical protein ACI9HE_004225, partial [Planctomycetota bacterium]